MLSPALPAVGDACPDLCSNAGMRRFKFLIHYHSVPANRHGLVGLWRPVKLAIHTGVAQDGLHIFAGLGKGDGLDEFLGIAVVALSQPVSYAVGAGVVGGQGVLELSVVLIDHFFEITRTEF